MLHKISTHYSVGTTSLLIPQKSLITVSFDAQKITKQTLPWVITHKFQQFVKCICASSTKRKTKERV